MPWVKGQSGNPKGRQRKEMLTPALRALIQHHKQPDDTTGKAALAQAAFDAALSGDVAALKFVWDRIDGPLAQDVALSGRLEVALSWPEGGDDADA